jgi:hypothetical protein
MDDLQSDYSELIKDFMRHELGKDHYESKIRCVVVTSNTVTGRVSIDTCANPPLLERETKSLLMEAREQIRRLQQANTLRSVIQLAVNDVMRGQTSDTIVKIVKREMSKKRRKGR